MAGSRAGAAAYNLSALFPDDLHLTWDAADAFAAQQQGLANKRRLLGFYGNSQVRLSPPDGRCLTSPANNDGDLVLAACTSAANQVWMLPEPGVNLRIRVPTEVGRTIHDHSDILVSWQRARQAHSAVEEAAWMATHQTEALGGPALTT
jgi:hypothetical protein